MLGYCVLVDLFVCAWVPISIFSHAVADTACPCPKNFTSNRYSIFFILGEVRSRSDPFYTIIADSLASEISTNMLRKRDTTAFSVLVSTRTLFARLWAHDDPTGVHAASTGLIRVSARKVVDSTLNGHLFRHQATRLDLGNSVTSPNIPCTNPT